MIDLARSNMPSGSFPRCRERIPSPGGQTSADGRRRPPWSSASSLSMQVVMRSSKRIFIGGTTGLARNSLMRSLSSLMPEEREATMPTTGQPRAFSSSLRRISILCCFATSSMLTTTSIGTRISMSCAVRGVEVALEVGGVDDVDDAFRLAREDVVASDALILARCGGRRDGVDAGRSVISTSSPRQA